MKRTAKSILAYLAALAMLFSFVAQAAITDSNVNEPGTIPVLKEPTKITIGVTGMPATNPGRRRLSATG